MSFDVIKQMPDEYKGKTYKNKSRLCKTHSRRWSDKEIEWLEKCLKEGYTTEQISQSMDRSIASVSLKRKRLSKKKQKYNPEHYKEKYEYNKRFLNYIKPHTILDLYNGGHPQYKQYDTVTNDLNTEFDCDYHMEAEKLLMKLYLEGRTFDLIDLDPFGSAWDCFDLSVRMASKGLIVTFGEMGHLRWKRLDFVGRYYGISSLDDFTSDNLIKYVQMIGRRNKKELKVVFKKDWRNITRVYFKIEPYMVIKDWE